MCPYLNSSDFYLWGPLKSKVYANNPHSLEELKQNIRHELGAISEHELRRVARHFFRRCKASQIAQGHHLERVLSNRYVYHYALLTAKARNKSSVCSSTFVSMNQPPRVRLGV